MRIVMKRMYSRTNIAPHAENKKPHPATNNYPPPLNM